MVLYAIHPGIGLYSDSTYYLTLARRLLSGHGYTIPDIHGDVDPVNFFPFVYPTLLALPGLLGVDLLVGARWIAAIVFFANVQLTGAIAYRRCGQSLGATGLAVVLGLASYDMLSYHTLLLSDAASLTFVLLAFMLMGNYLETTSWGSFAGAAAATALAFATRYAAAGFVIAGFAAILLWEKKSFARRLVHGVLFGLGSSSLMIFWMLRNSRYSDEATGRSLEFHPVLNMAQLRQILVAISTWATNRELEGADVWIRASIVAAIVVIALAAAVPASRGKAGTDLGPALPLLYILTYVVELVMISTFVQADLFLDGLNLARLLLPVHVLVIVLVVQMGSRLYQRLNPGGQRAAASILCTAISTCFLVWTIQWAHATHRNGQGFANSTFANSEMLQTIRGLPKDARYYSNLPWPIAIYTDRLWKVLPPKIDDDTAGQSTEYREQMEDFAKTMREHHVYLAYFKEGDDWFEFPSLNDLQAIVPMRAVAETKDGTIYAAAGQ